MSASAKFPTGNATAISGSWTNGNTGLNADDGTHAQFTTTTKNDVRTLECGNFGFDSAIPSGAVISQVDIEVQEQVTSGGTLRTTAYIGTTAGTNNDNTTDTSLTTRTYSNISRPGGGSWTRADLLDGTFKVRVEGRQPNNTTSRTYQWDYVKVTVTYQTTPTIALNTADATNFGSDTTPTLEFTGTDADGDDVRYNVQVDTVNTFDSQGSESSVDSQTGDTGGGSTSGPFSGFSEAAQSFTPSQTVTLTKVTFRIYKQGSPTGNCFAKIYAHSGTYGTSSVPTGSALATSDAVDISTIPTTYANAIDQEFTFSGANQIELTAGTRYVVSYVYSGGNSSNRGQLPLNSGASHGGNKSSLTDPSTWSPDSATDLRFSVYGTNLHPLLDKVSGTDSGFANTVTGGDTDPFNSGEKASFTVQAGDALADGTYYWRARAIDPSGSNTYSSWATARSFTISASETITPDKWHPSINQPFPEPIGVISYLRLFINRLVNALSRV